MKKAIYSEKASKGDGPYSQAIVSNGFVFVSGQGPLDAKTGGIIGNSITEQTQFTLENIKNILESAGCLMDDVVKVNVFLQRIEDFNKFNEVYKEYFSDPKPARTCVAANLDNILVEIDAIARA